MDRVEMMKRLCSEKVRVYEAKNSDYGDSFAKVRKEYPEAIVIRLMDKLERLKTLLKGKEQKVGGESIEDTLLDMSNYCDMEIIERRIDENKKQEIACVSLSKDDPRVQKCIDELMQPIDYEVAKDRAEHYWQGRG